MLSLRDRAQSKVSNLSHNKSLCYRKRRSEMATPTVAAKKVKVQSPDESGKLPCPTVPQNTPNLVRVPVVETTL